MDKEQFKKEMEEYVNKDIDYDKIQWASINRCSREIKNIIVMEELSELIKEVSKAIRGEDNYLELVEEIADVLIGIDLLKKMYNISDRDIMKAYDIKTLRESKRCNLGGGNDGRYN